MKVMKPEPGREIYYIGHCNTDGDGFPGQGYRIRAFMNIGDDNYVKDTDSGIILNLDDILAWRYVRPEFTEDDLAQIRAMEEEYGI
jgi:hypothetical protein